MKHIVILLSTAFIMFSCTNNSINKSHLVKNMKELNAAIGKAVAGDEIVLSNGVWNNAQINFYGEGTQKEPILLRAETPGKVFIESKSFLHLGGKHLEVSGLYFRNGYSPATSIIRFKINEDSVAFNCKVSQCVIENFTKPNRLTNDHWIEFYGKHNTLTRCYIAGKSNDGETLRVFQTGNKHNQNYHQITNNYFGPRPRKGGPRAETVRIGDSKTHYTPGFVNVSDNYFEACNGEVETISDKTNFNTFRNNIFYKCEGSLVLRHGSFATVDKNIFIGGDESDFYGGIRVVNTGHWITNNYFYKINGSKFRSPLAVMNGIPKSQLNRYRQVTDVVVAYNTWVDCKSTWQVGVGQNKKSAGVLPEVEIRSAPPIRSIIANNLIYNHQADETPVINHDIIDGIKFKNNIIDNNGQAFTKFAALKNQKVELFKVNDWLYIPEKEQAEQITEVYNGFEFNKIQNDLFGGSRAKQNNVGAICDIAKAKNFKINKNKYGPTWFKPHPTKTHGKRINVSAKQGELANVILNANNGDILILTDSIYNIGESLKINKEITILPNSANNKALLNFMGDNNMPAFEMHPYGNIILKNIDIKGNNNQIAFAPLKENMAAAYKIALNNCTVEYFSSVIKAYKGSFADSINIYNSKLQNCESGIILAADIKGDYNAEMVTIANSKFSNINSNVINFFRGGYDESTIGGCLTLKNSTFKNCASKEKSGILIKTRGIINVNIAGNKFMNNPVKQIALLWGEKNNKHSNNTAINSGKIVVEEQLKLDILY